MRNPNGNTVTELKPPSGCPVDNPRIWGPPEAHRKRTGSFSAKGVTEGNRPSRRARSIEVSRALVSTKRLFVTQTLRSRFGRPEKP